VRKEEIARGLSGTEQGRRKLGGKRKQREGRKREDRVLVVGEAYTRPTAEEYDKVAPGGCRGKKGGKGSAIGGVGAGS